MASLGSHGHQHCISEMYVYCINHGVYKWGGLGLSEGDLWGFTQIPE